MVQTPHTLELDVKVRNVEFEGLTIRPGDHLIVRVPTHTTVADVDEVLRRMRERFADHEVEVTVIAAEQLAVVREEVEF